MSNKNHLENIGYFVSAPCSSGKTYAACSYIRDQKHLRNYIYVAPSLELLKQTKGALAAMGVKPTVITSETHPQHVKGAIIRHLKDSFEFGEVLLITWQAYVDLPYENRKENWQVIIDEVPQVDRFYPWNLPRNLRFITEYVDCEPITESGSIGRLVLRDEEELKRLLSDEKDDADEVFRPFWRDLLSDKKEMFVDLDDWNRLVDEGQVSAKGNTSRLNCLSMLEPEAIRGAILLGANVEDSLLVRWLYQNGCSLEEHREIAGRLRGVSENLGTRLQVSYFVPDRNFSKSLYRKADDEGVMLIDRMDALALEAFGSEKFLYVANNGRKSSSIDGAENVRKIPVISHGLNTYDDYNNIYFSAALNREPKHFSMLEALGLNPKDVHRAHSHEVVYQSVMRTSLRNPDSSEKVHAIVPDEPSARRLAELVGATEVKQFGALVERPRSLVPFSRSDINRRQTARKALEESCAPKTIPSSYIKDLGMESGAFLPQELEEKSFSKESKKSTGFAGGLIATRSTHLDASIEEVGSLEDHNHLEDEYKGGNSFKCFVTFHKNPQAYNKSQFWTREFSVHEFLDFLKKQAKAPVRSKEESYLFNPCIFDPPEGSGGYRKKAYFKQSSFLVLDFDGGSLSPDDFVNIFWANAKRGTKRSFVICNTFSRTPESPNKFRVIMFYKRPATDLQQHQAAYESVVGRLEEHGISASEAKLDPACRSGVQSFYLPCTSDAQERSAFIEAYGIKTRELKRCAIDPLELWKESSSKMIGAELRVGRQDVPEATVEQIAAITEPLGSMTEGRHQAIFDATFKMAKCGYPKQAIGEELKQVLKYEPRMVKKVDDALRSVDGYGWFKDRRPSANTGLR